MDKDAIAIRGNEARKFIVEEKNKIKQSEKLVSFFTYLRKIWMNALQEKKKTNANTNIGFLPTLIIIFVSNDTLLFGTNSIRYFFWIHVGLSLIHI